MAVKVFVSSTYVDLHTHRQRVITQLRRAGYNVDPMEDWTSDADEPRQFSLHRLDGCQVCVLLVGFRRGFVPARQARSITQMEYDHASTVGSMSCRSCWMIGSPDGRSRPMIARTTPC
jgi:hypothetical protein